MDEPLRLFVIYDHPSDFPNHFVVRQWLVRRLDPTESVHRMTSIIWAGGEPYLNEPVDPAYTFDSLDSARAHASGCGRACIARNEKDDPKIVETWI